jgi:hypothetical protein
VNTNFCKFILWVIQQDKSIMRVELQNDQSGEVLSKQLFDIGNGKIPVDPSSGYIIFPNKFCHYTETKTEPIEKVLPNNAQNYKYHHIFRFKIRLMENYDIQID